MFPHHNYLNISLTVFGGIYLFFVIERLLKITMDVRARRAEEEGKDLGPRSRGGIGWRGERCR